MVITKLQGGLGNQLFQYVAALLTNKGETAGVLLDTSYYLYVRNRRFCLDELSLPNKTVTFFNYPLEFPIGLPFVGSYWEKFYAAIFPKRLNFFTEMKHFTFDFRLAHGDQSAYLQGFWQHHKYVELVGKKLRSLIKFPQKAKKSVFARSINSNPQSVSLHIRRGDYLKSSAFPVCSFNYYQKATEYMTEHLKVPYFFIFSDDPIWCESKFSFLPNYSVVKGTDEITDLFLMSQCKHHIIANSTFSWWGAWLNDKGITIAPRQWSKSRGAASALLYDHWIAI